MLVRRYVVSAMPEAVNQIRRELGMDAVILSSKKIRLGGWLGLFKREKIEVIAAMATPEQQSNERAKPIAHLNTDLRDTNTQVGKLNSLNDIDGQRLLNEMQEMRKLLYAMAHPYSKGDPPQLVRLRERLELQGLSDAATQDVIDHARTVVQEGVKKGEELGRSVVEYMKVRLRNEVPTAPLHPTSRIAAFVGPTGVGKTTTIAKLAAQLILQDNRRPALITTDTYRIAAVDQLRTYATILGIPLEVAFTPEDIPAIFNRLNEHDVILVDTAGRNYRDQTMIDELNRMLDKIRPDETYLNLSMTAKQSDLMDIVDSFERTRVDKFVFTKLDETNVLGAAYNLIDRFSRPVAYTTHGQSVPDDFEVASLDRLCTLIVGDVWYERSS